MSHSRPRRHADPADGLRPARRLGRRAGIIGLTGAALVLAAGGVAVGVEAARAPASRPGIEASGGGAHARHHDTARLAANDQNIPMLGVDVVSPSDLSDSVRQFGRLPIVRVYYPGLPAANAWTSGLAGANHSAVIVSFKANPATILSGADDAVLTHFFDTAPTGHPIYFSYFHEPEDNIAAGQFTARAYRAAWHRVARLAAAAHNAYLHATLILMEYDLQPAAGRNWRDYFPGGGIIKVLGWDAYPTGSATDVDPQLTPPRQFMGPAIRASRSVGLPFGFAEFGLSRVKGRAAWMAKVGKYLLHSGALFGCLFNGNAEYPALHLTDAASVKVWRGFVKDSVTGKDHPVTVPTHHPRTSAVQTRHGSTLISELSLTPATVTTEEITAAARLSITLTLSHAADVTVLILNHRSVVVRQLAKPGQKAGRDRISYDGDGGSSLPLPPGQYTVLVVASTATSSGTAEVHLWVTP